MLNRRVASDVQYVDKYRGISVVLDDEGGDLKSKNKLRQGEDDIGFLEAFKKAELPLLDGLKIIK